MPHRHNDIVAKLRCSFTQFSPRETCFFLFRLNAFVRASDAGRGGAGGGQLLPLPFPKGAEGARSALLNSIEQSTNRLGMDIRMVREVPSYNFNKTQNFHRMYLLSSALQRMSAPLRPPMLPASLVRAKPKLYYIFICICYDSS